MAFNELALNYDSACVAINKYNVSSVVYNPPVCSKYKVESKRFLDFILDTTQLAVTNHLENVSYMGDFILPKKTGFNSPQMYQKNIQTVSDILLIQAMIRLC